MAPAEPSKRDKSNRGHKEIEKIWFAIAAREFCISVLLGLILVGTLRAQVLKGTEPKPEDPTRAILAAFDKYQVVGIGAAHGNKDLDDLILHLVRDPAFPSKVDDIAVECGNSLYQPILDRYIAGDNVTLAQVRPVWRDTALSMCNLSGFYEILYPLVRRINQRRTDGKKLRVLAGDPPFDWSKAKGQSEVFDQDRDANIASVMEKDVLSKHRKALMLFGDFHLFHSNFATPNVKSAVERYEVKYPKVTFVIGQMIVSHYPIPKPVTDEIASRMALWVAPSLAQNLKGTWLATVEDDYFAGMIDAYLYQGPVDLMLAEPLPAEVFLDKEYVNELRRRAGIIGPGILAPLTDPDTKNYSPFLY